MRTRSHQDRPVPRRRRLTATAALGVVALGAGVLVAAPAAQAADLETMLADDLHDPPAFHGIELVVIPVQVRYSNDAHGHNRSSISTVGLSTLPLSILRFLLIY